MEWCHGLPLIQHHKAHNSGCPTWTTAETGYWVQHQSHLCSMKFSTNFSPKDFRICDLLFPKTASSNTSPRLPQNYGKWWDVEEWWPCVSCSFLLWPAMPYCSLPVVSCCLSCVEGVEFVFLVRRSQINRNYSRGTSLANKTMNFQKMPKWRHVGRAKCILHVEGI